MTCTNFRVPFPWNDIDGLTLVFLFVLFSRLITLLPTFESAEVRALAESLSR